MGVQLRWAFALLLFPAVALADDRRDAVCVTVGARKITVGELEDRMAGVPRFQLGPFGNNDAEITKGFVDQVVLPEALYAMGAETRGLDKQLPTSYLLERARSTATMNAVRAQIGAANAIPMSDVQAYYDANKAHYDAPERYRIWRILCKTEDESTDVLASAKKDPTPKEWEDLARQHSLDKGSYLKGGDLGVVAPDGTSNESGLKIDPALFTAAGTVKDGEIVPQPVAEGSAFAVVWRRGTIPASHRSVDDAAAQIRDTLWKQRVEQAQKTLIDDLRAKNVKELHEDLLEGIEISSKDGNVAPKKRPGQVAPLTPGASSSTK
jgi:peptidyl-prolyl cis-trans isomerase C